MHGRRALWFILSGVLFVLIVLASAYIVLAKFRPEDEIRRMLLAMSEVSTARERSAFSWTRGEGRERTTTSLYTIGQLDVSDPGAFQHATKFRLFRLSKAADYADLSGELRKIDGTTYLTYAPPGPDVEGLDFENKETWVSFDEGELSGWGALIPGLDAPFQSDFSRVESNATKVAGNYWTPEGLVRLRELLSKADIFLVSYDDVTELIDAEATRVIDGQFDPDAIRAFLRDLIRAKEGREPTTAERVTVEAQAKAIETLSLRLWIGIEDHLLYRFQVAGTLSEEGSNVLVPFDAIVELSDFNAPFDAAVPSDFTPFSAVISKFYGGLSVELGVDGVGDRPFVPDDAARLPTSDTDTSDDPDNDGLSNIVEAFYLTNPKLADTDGDGASDGEEVLSGKNPRGEGSLFGFGLGE